MAASRREDCVNIGPFRMTRSGDFVVNEHDALVDVSVGAWCRQVALATKAIQGGIKGGCGMNVAKLLRRLGESRRRLARRVLRERRLTETLDYLLPRRAPNGRSGEHGERSASSVCDDCHRVRRW